MVSGANDVMVEDMDQDDLSKDKSGGKFVEIMYDETDFFIINSTKMIPLGSMDDVFILEKVDTNLVNSILFIHSCVPPIKEFIFLVRTDPMSLKSPYMKNFEDLLSKLVFFITDTTGKDPFTCEGIPIKHHQKLLREIKIIDLLIDILIYPFDGKEKAFDIK